VSVCTHRANAAYCSNKCRQKAYRTRKAARYGKLDCRDTQSVTQSEGVTEAPIAAAANP
jgi:hypothetical protein